MKRKRAIIKLIFCSPFSFLSSLPSFFLPPPSFFLLLPPHRIPKGARCPVMQMLIERIVLTNESSIDKNFAFYVPRDDNRFKFVLVPGYGVLSSRAPR